MDPGVRYAPSHALELRIDEVGALRARASISEPARPLTPDLMLVLLAFAGGATLAEASARLGERYGVDEAALARAAAGLIERGYVVPVGAAPAAPATGAFASVLRHAWMIGDHARVDAYREALARAAPGRRVLDLGTGSGLLAVLAARAGAHQVVAVEEAAIALVAQQVFAAADAPIQLVRRSSLDVTLDERVDVVVHELLGSDPLAEGLLASISDARRRLLVPGGALIPYRIEILCAGVDAGPTARDRAAARAAVTMDAAFAPLAAAVEALPSRAFVETLGDVAFEVLTEPVCLHDLDLRTVDEDACAATVTAELRATRAGRVNAIALWFRAHLDDQVALTNAPDAPLTHWGHRVTSVSAARDVRPGDRIAIAAHREVDLKHERLVVDVA